ncbi:MAG: PepSY-associated TM helix domain-containing protein [Cyanobacteriota bacterium]
MALNKMTTRKIHRMLAPLLFLPLVVTVLTGSLYQIALLNQTFDYYWLIQIHKGQWGPLNLQAIYPFLNGMGLLVMAATGLRMWWQTQPKRHGEKRGS